MRSIKISDVGQKLKAFIENPDPVDEDILIQNESGKTLGAVITNEAYAFLLRKIEEAEDKEDKLTIEEFNKKK